MHLDKRKALKYIAVFLGVMLVFTLVSNKVNYLMMPEIATVRPSKGQLGYQIIEAGIYYEGKVGFMTNLEKDAYLQIGDRLTAEFANNIQRLQLVIEGKEFDEDTQSINYICRLDEIPETALHDGQMCTVRYFAEIGSFDRVLPRECIVQEGMFYVYILETTSTAFGEDTTIRKIEVSVLAEDETSIAISPDFSEQNFVVRYSTKPLRNEQKVRVIE